MTIQLETHSKSSLVSETRLPPGPRFAPVQTYRYIRDPYGYYADCVRKYGDPFTVPGLAVGSIVVTGHRDGIRDVFSADPDTFVPFAPHVLAPVLGETSVLHTSGARHKRDRKLLTPAFHGARMRAYGDTIVKATLCELSNWSPGRSVPFHSVSQSISLEIIVRAVFGINEDAKVELFREAIENLMNAMAPAILFFPGLRRNFGGLGPWARFSRHRSILNALLFEEIAERRRTGRRGTDVFSQMLDAKYDDGSGMSDEDIRNQLATLLVAGHETTGIALCWALYWLLRSPDMLQRLRRDIDQLGPDAAPDAIAALPYLDALCAETLRMYPIFPDTRRRLARPLKVRGYTLPAGVAISVAPMLVHQDESIYSEPSQFRPERFLERTYSPFEYVPFGGGARRCLGAAFAMYEMKVVLGTLVRWFELELSSDALVIPTRRNVTMSPSDGVPVRLVGRRPS